MRWGFDARAAFIDPFRGFGRMVRELVPALCQQAGAEVVLCLPASGHIPREWYPLPRPVLKLQRPRRGAFLWDGPAWAWTVRRHRLQGLHLPAWGVPPGLPVPVVATFHDATPLLYPQALSWWQRWRLASAIASLRRATLVHAVSHFAARQLVSFYPALGSRTLVVPHGVSPRFCPADLPGSQFVLGVGGGEKHKNWDLMLELYAQPAASSLPPLLLVGQVARDVRWQARLRALGLEQRVKLVAALSEDELISCYQRALALVFPSLNEGFGLPALEAMACGCPVLAANAGALPEVCGEAALLLPAHDPKAWLEALQALASDPSLRESLRQRGLARARGFTWEATARGLLELYGVASRRESSSR